MIRWPVLLGRAGWSHECFSVWSHANRSHPRPAPELPSAGRRHIFLAVAGCGRDRRSPFQRAVPLGCASAAGWSHFRWREVTTVAAAPKQRSLVVSTRHRAGSSWTAEESNLMTTEHTTPKDNRHHRTSFTFLFVSRTRSLKNCDYKRLPLKLDNQNWTFFSTMTPESHDLFY